MPLFLQIRMIAALLSLVSFSIASPTQAQDDAYFIVTAEGLSCVASHVDDYSVSEGETLFVSLIECNQDSSGQISLLDMVQNSAPDISLSAEDGPDSIVALSPGDLACIEALAVSPSGQLFAFYPNGCRLVER